MNERPPELDIEDAALVLTTCATIIERLERLEIMDKAPYEPLPRGVMSCGQAMTVVPLLLVMITKEFPMLLDQETLVHVLRDATLKRTTGQIN